MSTSEAPGHAPLLDIRDLVVEYPRGRLRPPLRAVDTVSITIAAGETVGLVGESGSGKSTIGRAVLGLAPITQGTISFGGADITRADRRCRQRLSADLQVVFQDPYSSLNPTRTIGQTLAEMLRVPANPPPEAVTARVHTMLKRVGLPPEAAARHPAGFSGGQRQRIAIARALMRGPRLVICDEPVSALDLSVQAQVLNLLRELQTEMQLSYLFIAHDLPVVRHLSHRIVVLYRGQVMETGDAATVYAAPAHPYTRTLLEATPVPDPTAQRAHRRTRTDQVEGTAARQLPDHFRGCPFALRCGHAVDRCFEVRPTAETTPEASQVACHRWQDLRQVQRAQT